MSQIGNLPKDGYNSFHKYNYVMESTVLEHMRDICIKEGVLILPSVMAVQHVGEITTVEVKYDIIDTESGEHLTLQSYGQGQDKGDKGIYKAITGAYKYFALKTFMIPTGDDPERDSDAPRAPQGNSYQPKQEVRQAPPSQPRGNPEFVQRRNDKGELETISNVEVPEQYWKLKEQKKWTEAGNLLHSLLPGYEDKFITSKKSSNGKWYIAYMEKQKKSESTQASLPVGQTFDDDDIPF